MPAQSEIDEALTHVGYQNVKLLGNNQVQLLNGAQSIGRYRQGAMQATSCTKWWRATPRISGTFWRG